MKKVRHLSKMKGLTTILVNKKNEMDNDYDTQKTNKI